MNSLRVNDPTNPTIRDFDLDGVIDGCIGSLHMFRQSFIYSLDGEAVAFLNFMSEIFSSCKNRLVKLWKYVRATAADYKPDFNTKRPAYGALFGKFHGLTKTKHPA